MVSICENRDEVYQVLSLATQYQGKFSQLITCDLDYAMKSYGGLIDQGVCTVFALKSEGVIVGGLAAIKYPDLNCGVMTAVECFWFVNESDRGKGMLLLAAFEKWADDQGCKRKALIHLVDSFPDKLAKLYKRKGYRLIEHHWVKE